GGRGGGWGGGPGVGAGRWWRTCRGRPSPAAGASGNPACAPSPLLTVAARRVEGRADRLAERGVHEIGADVGVDRRRSVAAMPHLLLDEPAVRAVLGQVGDLRMTHGMGRQLT